MYDGFSIPRPLIRKRNWALACTIARAKRNVIKYIFFIHDVF